MLNRTDLSRIDLNLLVVFEAVLEERHVARAASRLHVSPSAVSHGLGRLRRLMHDPLFLRQPKGVVPTERARQLAAPVADILERARQVMTTAVGFDPTTSRRRFVIGAPDGAYGVLLPPLLAELRRTAPGIDLAMRNLVGGQFEWALTELDERRLDLAIMPFAQLPARFAARKLYDEDFVLARGAQAGGTRPRKLTLAQYCELPHLVVSASGDPSGPIDAELEKRGHRRRVVLTVSNFLQALAIVAETDLVAALPRQFARKHAARYAVRLTEPPFPMLSAPLRLVVPEVATRDAGLAWLVELLEKTARRAVS
ncbi:MAG TPA: LysR substrate-binding domain-containing protein [Steroidobacteraceae bacterium]|nr:LysR substrate-binding domain-containing protein [Steroidobacteraceae bacterium]